MLANFLEQQIQIARVYHCPYHPIHAIGEYRRDSFDRKPNPDMLFACEGRVDLDLASCLLIGDKLSDIAAGQAAGVGTTILLDSSHREG
jgi:D-glycero-D-manno-heptose 1,7-bisphosphate phosphatase